MFLLFACAEPPTLSLPVLPPTVDHASAMPAARFVGAWTIGPELCGGDPAAGLADGTTAWRVLTLVGDHLVLPDGTRTHATEKRRFPELVPLARRWAEADTWVAESCGAAPDTRVLLAVDADASFDVDLLMELNHALPAPEGSAALRLLVRDPTPDTPEPAPFPASADGFYILSADAHTWAGLSSNGDQPAFEVASAAEAVEVLEAVLEGAPRPALLTVGPASPWSRYTEGLDAFAARGRVPMLALTVGGEAPPPRAPIRDTPVHIRFGDTVPVLRPIPPGYGTADTPGGSRGVLLQVIGTTPGTGSPPPAEAAPDVHVFDVEE